MDKFIKKYGAIEAELFDHTSIPPQSIDTTTLKSAMKQMTKKSESTGVYYINDLNLVGECPKLVEQLQKVLADAPFLQSDGSLDLLRFLNPQLFRNEKLVQYINFYLYIGQTGTTTALHMDTLSTNAMNIVWTGCKRWWFILSRDEDLVGIIFVILNTYNK